MISNQIKEQVITIFTRRRKVTSVK